MRLVLVNEEELDRIVRREIFPDGGPTTEDVYLDLSKAPRVELFDGSLFVSPRPSARHQRMSKRLWALLDEAAANPGLEVHLSMNLRLRPGLITIADIAVTNQLDGDVPLLDATAVCLVCEITSPVRAAIDGIAKMHYYAMAGIPWYLMIDEDGTGLHLYRLADGAYSLIDSGKTLRLVEPLVATIDPAELLRRR